VRAIGASTRSAAIPEGVSGAQVFALRQIASSPGMSIGELANRTMARQSSVSELVARLVANGLVLRRSDSDDARQVHLHLTAKGKKTVTGSDSTIQERLIAGLKKMPQKKREALADALEEWRTASGLTDVPPTMFFERQDD